ncbi:Hypothetical predicted protein [Olea europaea subsp. europaea]|uniref:Uncharacterized protein n=1 Tax=Olea europaea subsp. europaea TaxID=158383 RepID=A0A8S0PH85_OLEEU|nr:Hypothetical predicted protein [Olea europaea subsp. europaea]
MQAIFQKITILLSHFIHQQHWRCIVLALKELEDGLRAAGNELLKSPSSTDELLTLLEKVENLLPKGIFGLFTVAFEKLSYESGRTYERAAQILQTVASVRSCLMMVDIECDALIGEMFQLFFKTIRSNHPPSVFTHMETIMTLVIQESDEISFQLLSPLLVSVTMNNKVAKEVVLSDEEISNFEPEDITPERKIANENLSNDENSQGALKICQQELKNTDITEIR